MFLRLVNLLRPRGGWLVLILLLATVVCLPLSVADAGWLIGAPATVGVALLAGWLGFSLGHTRLPGWLVGTLGVLAGVEWNAVTLARLAPGAGALAREALHAVRWLWLGLRGQWTADLPLVSLWDGVWVRSLALLERLRAWSQAGLEGTVSRDNLVLLLLAAVGVWWVSYYAGWQLARGRSALAAFLPAGALILANVALTYGAGIHYLRGYLGGALLLMVLGHYDRQQARWEREGIDFSLELKRSAQVVGTTLAVGLIVAALLVPYFTWQQAVDLFWRYAYEPWTTVTQRLDRLFAARNPVQRPQPSSPSRPSEGAHELAGQVDLGSNLVFYVRTSDPPPVPPEMYEELGGEVENPKHYWREITYDTYTGRGWENSQAERTRRDARAPLAASTFLHTILTQTYELRLPGEGLVPAVNEPLLVDRASTVVLRGEEDLAGIVLRDRQYTVVSRVPSPTISQLRQAGRDYPPEVITRYLALPQIPGRVQALAEELTAEAQTPYDKAVTIEKHLRGYEYDLDIPAPPPGDDVADYLLFKTRRGYCDYYATAMVVMLRAVGVPARYAAGYAMGQYDPGRDAYLVSERDAHAWVEVYFPGYGWIEFEPTPYRGAFSRPAGDVDVPYRVRPLPRTAGRGPSRAPWPALAALAVAALALGGVTWWALQSVRGRLRQTSGGLVRQLYAQMLRWAERVHLGPTPGDTPLEFGRRLGRALEVRGPWARGASADAHTLTSAYVHALYAPTPLSARDAGRALEAWERLRARLRRLFFRRR